MYYLVVYCKKIRRGSVRATLQAYKENLRSGLLPTCHRLNDVIMRENDAASRRSIISTHVYHKALSVALHYLDSVVRTKQCASKQYCKNSQVHATKLVRSISDTHDRHCNTACRNTIGDG